MASLWRHDVYLVAGLTVFGAVAYYLAREQLLAVKNDAKITKAAPPAKVINQSTEDAVKLEALEVLLESPNYELQGAAVKIITNRATKPHIYQALLHKIRYGDIPQQEQALASLRYLVSYTNPKYLNPERTLSTVITFLSNNQPKFPTGVDADLPLWKLRSEPVKDALHILDDVLSSLSSQTFPTALKAGLVSKWLSKYPFGGPSATEAAARDELRSLNWDSEDLLLFNIIKRLFDMPAGRRELRKYGLLGSSIEESSDENMIWFDEDAQMSGYNRMPGLRREHDESPEEQRLRRRRREAMVLSDGDEVVTNENITW
jgi:hypothetical protein